MALEVLWVVFVFSVVVFSSLSPPPPPPASSSSSSSSSFSSSFVVVVVVVVVVLFYFHIMTTSRYQLQITVYVHWEDRLIFISQRIIKIKSATSITTIFFFLIKARN